MTNSKPRDARQLLRSCAVCFVVIYPVLVGFLRRGQSGIRL